MVVSFLGFYNRMRNNLGGVLNQEPPKGANRRNNYFAKSKPNRHTSAAEKVISNGPMFESILLQAR